MAWIADVAPNTTILSTWGNNIRDHVVQVFASVAERNANAAKMIEGDVCYTVAEATLFVRRASAANGFGTLDHPWQGFATTFTIGGSAIAISQGYGYYRRIGAHAVQASWNLVTTGNYVSGGGVVFTIPVPAAPNAQATAQMIGTGIMNDNTKRVLGHIECQQAGWAVLVDPSNGQYFTAIAGPVYMKANVEYEVADG